MEGSSPDNRLLPYYPSRLMQNLAYHCGNYGINVGSGYTTSPGFEKAYLRNNIALDNTNQDVAGENAAWTDSDYNFIGNASDLANLRSIGGDSHSLTGDPKWVNMNVIIDTTFLAGWSTEQKLNHIRAQVLAAFQPLADSGLIDAGVVVSGYHNPGPNPGGSGAIWYGSSPDIGPIEFVPSGPWLRVTSPNGGEAWPRNHQRIISWNAGAFDQTPNLVIELLQNGNLVGTIATVPATPGSYLWTVGTYQGGTISAGSGYRVRVRTEGGAILAQINL